MLRKGLPFSSYSSQILSRPNLPRPIRSLLPVMDLNISVSFRRKQDVDDPGCIQTLQGTVGLRADDGSSQYVGSIKAYRIDRRACKEEFYDILGCRGETRRFSRACFDKLGFVHSRLLMDEYHKGSGCWQEEVNRGKIVYISNIFIEEQYRSRGIGSRVLKALVDLDYVNDVDIVYCEPVSPDPSDIEDQTLSMDPSSQARRTSFFHKNGFRRLGRTSWLAFSCDPSHPSRSLDISDEPRDDSQFSHDPVMTGKICQSDFPLNWAILNDKERSPSSIGRVVAMIRDAHEVSPAAIHAQDPIGATPLHMAGMCGHVQAIRTLLELGASSDLNIRNSYGKTPSDCCIEELEEIRRSQERTWRQMMGISCWAGFPETKLRALGILRHAMGLEITEEEFMKQYKFGCTCGSCVDGWLSKRMKYYLIKSAMDIAYKEAPSDRKIHSSLVISSDITDFSSFYYIPPNLRKIMSEAYRQGYRNVFRIIISILSSQGESSIPSPDNIKRHIRSGKSDNFNLSSVQHYLDQGGLVDFAVDCLIDSAKRLAFDDIWLGVKDSEITRCANDLEFDLIRHQLDLNKMTCGPIRWTNKGDLDNMLKEDLSMEDDLEDW